ncbi:guanine nucleotide exchange protein for ADP-robosylation factor [Malassezia sp. CBS 17886]|nr:guanine nucleotide exchange protein for ADP-robosylation factor [Malassezia sp. CBS 17886]
MAAENEQHNALPQSDAHASPARETSARAAGADTLRAPGDRGGEDAVPVAEAAGRAQGAHGDERRRSGDAEGAFAQAQPTADTQPSAPVVAPGAAIHEASRGPPGAGVLGDGTPAAARGDRAHASASSTDAEHAALRKDRDTATEAPPPSGDVYGEKGTATRAHGQANETTLPPAHFADVRDRKEEATPPPAPSGEAHDEGDTPPHPPFDPFAKSAALPPFPKEPAETADDRSLPSLPTDGDTPTHDHADANSIRPSTQTETIVASVDVPDGRTRTDSSPRVPPVRTEAAPAGEGGGGDAGPTPPPSARAMQHSASSAHSLSRGSAVFVISALETIGASKEARRSKELREAAATALDMVRRATGAGDGTPVLLDPRVVLEPLRLACGAGNVGLQTASLDCIAKLVSYAFFAPDDRAGGAAEGAALADLVVDTVCAVFDDQVDERLSVQIVKALLACVLSPSLHVHQSSLLRSVRTVYNVYLMSRTPANQALAQGSLAQMISYVFARVPRRRGGEEGDGGAAENGEPVTLQMLESRRSFEGDDDELRTAGDVPVDAPDLLVKDAFLVLRALCKLSMKPLGGESERDVRSHAMRSKLLSLHMIHSVLELHMDLFTDGHVQIQSTTTGEQTSFVHAVKQYLCLALSRNAVSRTLPVFEVSCEIFWLVVAGMRTKVKKEIEVLLNEIFLPILEMRSSTAAQKGVLLTVVHRLCRDPQALVEIYLNYDCDRSALENVYERLMNVISRVAQAPPGGAGAGETEVRAPKARLPGGVPVEAAPDDAVPPDVRLKRQALDCLCSVLHSLVAWSGRGTEEPVDEGEERAPEERDDVPSPMPERDDDPGRFENAKARKTTLLEAIRTFNYKPQRGINDLIAHGFIRAREPRAIARFLFYADGLSKTNIGEYLGEGDAENIAVMHAFVDLMDFDRLPFTSALRRFLQAFRLPGEAQKIDRYMLKFAERYVAGNKHALANADTAYVLAYSVILLNTDAHNPQVKHRMSLQDFVKNNAGIDDGKNLPDAFLHAIYDEIQHHEIKMNDEGAAAPPPPPPQGLANALASVGRDLQREAYVLQSEGMANRTEVLFRTMLHTQRRASTAQRALADQFFSASHVEHVRPMFEVAWMSFLAGISAPLQDSDDADIIRDALRGFHSAVKIVCFFGLELERNAFVTTLAKFTFLNNLGEMKAKNIQTIKALLGIARTEGNYLRGSWREVLACVSQLERFQLISGGVDERMLPDLGRRAGARPAGVHLPQHDVVQAGASTEITLAADRVFSTTPRLSGEAIVDFVQSLCDVSWEEIQSSGMSDNPRLFSLQKLVEISYYNMGRIRMEWSRLWAILGAHFNHVCCHVNPAVSAFGLDSLRQLASQFLEKDELLHFTFQKDFLRPFECTMRRNGNLGAKEMVLQCLEQMVQSRAERIRSGWSTMLGVFGVAASTPERIAAYAFDLVRDVHARHLDAIVANGSFPDLCVCIAHFAKTGNQRISLPATDMLRGLVEEAADEPAAASAGDAASEGGAASGGDAASEGEAASSGDAAGTGGETSDGDATTLDLEEAAAGEAASEAAAEKGATEAGVVQDPAADAATRNAALPAAAPSSSPRSPVTPRSRSPPLFPLLDHWLPVLFALYDIVMTGDDLEVRRVALDALFATLTAHGSTFPPAFWDTVCDDVLFPIFNVLRNRSDVTRFSSQEDMSVWLSTTMIQALRHLVALWTVYFGTLQRRLPGLLELLCACICQENDTLARIGTSCLQQLIVQNVARMDDVRWQQTTDAFLRLFRATTAAQVFDPALSAPAPSLSAAERRQAFKQIIVKCVLQLLLIETTHELLQHPAVYEVIPVQQLLRLTQALEDSYRFSRRFNANRALRTALWKVGFMKQLPNLLKQESTSASTLVHVYLRMQSDPRDAVQAHHAEISQRFLPLAEEIISVFLPLDNETQARNITAWTPVVAQAVHGLAALYESPTFADAAARDACTHTFYLLVVELLDKVGVVPALAAPLRHYLAAVGIAHGLADLSAAAVRAQQREEAQLMLLRATPSTVSLASARTVDLSRSASLRSSSDLLAPDILASSDAASARVRDVAREGTPVRASPPAGSDDARSALPRAHDECATVPEVGAEGRTRELGGEGDADGHGQAEYT